MACIQSDVASMLGATLVEITYEPDPLRVSTDASGVVGVTGEIDASTAPKLRSALEQFASSGRPLYLDLSQVGFLGSSGITELLHLDDELHGTVSIVATSPVVARVLAAAGLTTRFAPSP